MLAEGEKNKIIQTSPAQQIDNITAETNSHHPPITVKMPDSISSPSNDSGPCHTGQCGNAGLEVHQVDIKSAYLNALLNKTVYMKIP